MEYIQYIEYIKHILQYIERRFNIYSNTRFLCILKYCRVMPDWKNLHRKFIVL